jgi:hypothetical protein
LNGSVLQTGPAKKSRRFYLVLVTAFLLIVVLIIAVFLNQTISGPGPVEMAVESDKQVYLQGEEVNFAIYVNNPHDWNVPYPVSVNYIIGKDGVSVASIGGGQISYSKLPMFSPNTNTPYQELLTPWNQKLYVNGTNAQAEPGNYTLTVIFGGAVDYGDSGNCTFEIRPNS